MSIEYFSSDIIEGFFFVGPFLFLVPFACALLFPVDTNACFQKVYEIQYTAFPFELIAFESVYALK